MTRYCVSILIITGAALAADPPAPNPANPVNYVRWANAEYGARAADNAADTFLQAAGQYVSDHGWEIGRKRNGYTWSKRDRQTVATWVAKNQAAIDTYRRAARQKHCYFDYDGSAGALRDSHVLEIGTLYQMSVMLCSSARLRLIDGDVDGALERLGVVLQAGRHLERQLDWPISKGGIGSATEVYIVLRELPLLASDARSIESALATLKSIDRRPRSAREPMEGQTLLFLDAVQRGCRDTDGDGLLDEVSPLGGRATPIEPPIGIPELVESFHSVRDLYRKAHRSRFPVRVELYKQAEALLESNAVLGNLGVKRLARLDHEQRVRDAARAGSRGALWINLQHARTGKWPTTLREAMESEPSTTRWDPFSGDDLIYKLTDGKPLLYSVGPDGVDGGGKRGADLVYWPLPGADKAKQPPKPRLKG